MSASLAEKLVQETPLKGGDYDSKNRIPERLLARLWQKKAARQEWLRTQGGIRVRVIYPGSVGTGAGPDFRNALLEVEGQGIVRGDVEIHVRQKDWKSHGHGSDPNYNGVVLHAALEVESQSTELQSGRLAPVVSLVPLLASEGYGEHRPGPLASPSSGTNAGLWAVLNQHGYPAPKGPDEMEELLDLAGDHRFLAKSEYLTVLLREQTPEQTLYESLMEGLGYRYNQQPFMKLAARAPYAALERGARILPNDDRAQALATWLLKLAGLYSPPELSSDEPAGHESLPRVGFGAPLSSKEWHCFRLRPSNHPRRRIIGAAVLLDRFLDQGLVAGLAGASGAGSLKKLLAALMVSGQSAGQPALIGKDRASDLAVNVLLPFFHALDGLYPGSVPSGDPLGFYRGFGKLQDNEMIREMTGQLFDPAWADGEPSKIVNSARRQQGLLRLHAVLTGAA